ncbi:MAG: glutathione peroxidase [Bacteroidetes bacterium]|nr:glutathione peroxidase [Bacteroidota bacterium]
MKKIILLTVAIITATISFSQNKRIFYDFKVKDIDGNDIDLHKYKGKKILVVNVASECGYTPQYKELEWLYENYKDSNFVILAFPCNDFNGQEPGTPTEIKTFCSKNYGVTFPIMAKIAVKGKDICLLYSWLQKKDENGVQDNDVKWNFNKFMISENGEWQGYLHSKIKPNDKIITDWIMDR